MQVKDIINTDKPPITIQATGSVEQAMRLMIDNKIGSVIALDINNEAIGVLTERDIFHLTFRYRGDTMDILVLDHLPDNIILGGLEDDLSDISQVMATERIRYIPIIDEHQKLCGMISKGDIIRARSRKSKTITVAEAEKIWQTRMRGKIAGGTPTRRLVSDVLSGLET